MRLRRFEHHRFVGLRDTMTVFDTDDADQSARLAAVLPEAMERLAVTTFGPDTLAEARNRGFHSV